MNPDPLPTGNVSVLELIPIARTERLRIEPLCEDRFEEYCAIVCHPDTGLFDEEFPKDQAMARDSFEESIAREPFTPDCWNEYGVFNEDGELIGLLSHRDELFDNGLFRSRVGYHFHPDKQGKGFATESVRALLDSLNEQGVREVECLVHPDNARSIALLDRLCFERGEYNVDADELSYSILLI